MILFVLWGESWGACAWLGCTGDQRKDGCEAAQWGVPTIAAQLSFRAHALFLERGCKKEQSPWKPQNKSHIVSGPQEEGKQGGKGGMTAIKNAVKEQAWACLCWSKEHGSHRAHAGRANEGAGSREAALWRGHPAASLKALRPGVSMVLLVKTVAHAAILLIRTGGMWLYYITGTVLTFSYSNKENILCLFWDDLWIIYDIN